MNKARASQRNPKREVASPWADEANQREQTRKIKRDALLKVAAGVFRQNGFHRATLDDIAQSVGISKPTIYYHVGDKDSLFHACAARAIDEFRKELARSEKSAHSGIEALRCFVSAYLHAIMTDFGYCYIAIEDSSLTGETRKKVRRDKSMINTMLEKILIRGVADGSIDCADIHLTAFALFGALNWVTRWHDERFHPNEIEAIFWSLFQNGLKPRS